jgi:hypothetical protein
MFQMAIKYTKLFLFKAHKNYQIGIFGLKIYHLATLMLTPAAVKLFLWTVQGDQIGHILPIAAIVYYWNFCLNIKQVPLVFEPLFS